MALRLHNQLMVAALLLVFVLTPMTVYGQESYSVSSTELVVFRDGVVEVRQILSVNETEVSVTVTLLSSSVQNVLVLDQADVPLSYEVTLSDISITTLGASKVTLEYLTSDLTVKEGNVWTLKVNTPYDSIMMLPDQSNLIYLNDLPSSITSRNNRTVLEVTAGLWEISYIQALIVPQQTTITTVPTTTKPTSTPSTTTSPTTSTPSTTTSPTTSTPSTTTSPTTTPTEATTPTSGVDEVAVPFLVYYLVTAAAVLAVVGAFLLKRRGAEPKTLELRPEDREVLQFISEKGGKVLESELRVKFTLPKSSMWRLAKRLERMGYVRIVKVGIQNEIELVKGA